MCSLLHLISIGFPIGVTKDILLSLTQKEILAEKPLLLARNREMIGDKHMSWL
jgi:hypothetical protein